MNKNVALASVTFLCFLLSMAACTKLGPQEEPAPAPRTPAIEGYRVFVGQTRYRLDYLYNDNAGTEIRKMVDTTYTDTVVVNAGAETISFSFRNGTPTTIPENELWVNRRYSIWQYPSFNYADIALSTKYYMKDDSLFCEYYLRRLGGGYTFINLDYSGKRVE